MSIDLPSVRKRDVVTLMYHDVFENNNADASGFPGADPAHFKLDVEIFDRQLASIAHRCGERVSLLSDASLKKVPLVLTFDDGGVSAVTDIRHLLEARGMRGYFFITTDLIDTPGFMSRDQIRELHTNGHVIGSHSCSHPDSMRSIPREAMVIEWSKSKQVLEEILGETVDVASVPGGDYSNAVGETAAEAGYRLLFTSEPQRRPARIGDCELRGRYSITAATSSDEIPALCADSLSRAQLRQYSMWNTRKVAKRLAGPVYYKLRNHILERRFKETRHLQ